MSRVLPTVARASRRKNIWFERAMAIVALTNLGLVAFDATYVTGRDFWFRNLPVVTRIYDPLKGIEPHRDTQSYLEAVDALEREVRQPSSDNEIVKAQLQTLRDRSNDLIENNPFASANKSGTLEKIKNRIRDRVAAPRNGSSKQAFALFWSPEYLSSKGTAAELQFFDREIRPLMAVNYYRTIGENGDFTDWFWVIDAPFVALFALEFLARTFYMSRRFKSISWLDAMLWRWYDVLLLIPVWRLLRVIPVAIRLDHAGFINLDRVRTQMSQGIVANISEDVAEVVVIQVIDRLQESIVRGELTRWLVQSLNREYIDLNQRDEIQEITSHLLKTTVYSVLPKLRPDLEALLRHNIEAILNQSPAYQGLKMMPLVGDVPRQINERLVSEVTQGFYSAIVTALEDKAGTELINKLVKNFGQTLVTELQKERSLQELQSLVTDLLEEVKVNYVRKLEDEDVEEILEETRQLRQIDRR